jgi:SAM-dependent methyltransferase
MHEKTPEAFFHDILLLMDYSAQKNYFEIAYRTGSDVWTHIPYHHIALQVLPPLAPDAFVLDVGAGRGLWIGKLVADGNRVIGLEYINDVVKKGYFKNFKNQKTHRGNLQLLLSPKTYKVPR